MKERALQSLVAVVLFGPALCGWGAQAESSAQALPEAPMPQTTPNAAPAPVPCAALSPAKPTGDSGSAAQPAALLAGTQPAPCRPTPAPNWFARFLNGPEVKPLTVAEKARLAARNVLDPFNAITILGDAGITIGSDPHTRYGPGMRGFGKYVGVSYTQDITGEFFSTFLIPSIVHQDPHYHRMPKASIPRRIGHAIAQVVWTQGDNGKGMVNYGDLVGAAVSDEVNNLYVPGRQTNVPASAARYGIGLATAPADNFVSEFLPDLARHIHVQIVVIQRVINQVAKSEGAGGP